MPPARDLLQHSDQRSVQVLEKDLRAWVAAWNRNPRILRWNKTADQILESRARRTNGAAHWPGLPWFGVAFSLGLRRAVPSGQWPVDIDVAGVNRWDRACRWPRLLLRGLPWAAVVKHERGISPATPTDSA